MLKSVFLVGSIEDCERIPEVKDYLEKDLKIKCKSEEEILPGKPTIDNIVKEISECDRTLVVLTEKSVSESWVRYKTLLALERAQENQHLNLIIILFGISQTEIGKYVFGVLSESVTVDETSGDWKKDLKQRLEEERSVQQVLRTANVCTGQVWSHFTGYVKNVLPALKKKIEANDIFINNYERFPIVEFNFIPDSARSVKSLEELDSRIKKCVLKLDPIICSRGSYVGRNYDVTIYSITETVDGKQEKYYFVGQIPNSLSLLSKLEDEGSCSADCQHLKMTAGERSLQVSRFYFALNRLVNHPVNEDCHTLACFIPYDDTVPVGDSLLEKIKRHLQVQFSNHVDNSKGCGQQSPCDSGTNKSVFLDWVDECKQDVEIYTEVKDHLQNNGFQVHELTAGMSILDIETTMSRCKWVVCILSNESIEEKQAHVLRFRYRAALHRSVEENQVRVIPILDGIGESDIPSELLAVTCIERKESYLEKLVNTLKCVSIPMDSVINAVHVHEGLAWGYVLNYLERAWDGHEKNLNALAKEYPDKEVYRKLITIVPLSCCKKDIGALDKDKEGNIIDQRFQQLPVEDIKFTKQDVGGVEQRKYQLIPYFLEIGNKKHIVAMEFPNAVLCMKEMTDMEPVSGLTKDQLKTEVRKFTLLTQAIVDQHPKLKNKIKLVTFDDEKTKIYERMCELLDQDEGTPV